MNYILFDDTAWQKLLPLTFTRPVADLRVGILKIKEKWDKHLNSTCSYFTQDYLGKKFPLQTATDNIFINASLLPDKLLAGQIKQLPVGKAIKKNDVLLAAHLPENQVSDFVFNHLNNFELIECEQDIRRIIYPWDIFSQNGQEIENDFALLTDGRKSATISQTNNILGAENIFVEGSARVEFATINAENATVYIGKNAEIMEGSIVRGSLALCENAVLKMGSKIYGATTIGPHSKVGGEVNNSVIQGFSNKAHDGFLGNSVLGEWCNLGADTNNSNLKNNYAEVRVWNYESENFAPTGLQFCGLIMGDHSKCGINTMFNTGTVVGVSANIFGSGFPRNFVPSFSWGGAQGFSTYQPRKAFEVAGKVFERRHLKFDETEEEILTRIFDDTAKYRKY